MSQLDAIKWPLIFLVLPLIVGGILALLTVNVNNYLYGLSTFFITSYFLVVIAYDLFIVIAYGIYPLFLKTGKLFPKQGYANVIFEYQFLKKLLFVTLPFMVFYIYYFYSEISNNEGDTLYYSVSHTVTYYANIVVLVPTSAFLIILIQSGKKDFRFYFAKGCCKIISEKEDDLEKMRYLRLLFGSYDAYLKRTLKAGIDEKRIYSIILYENTKERNNIINSICQSLEGDKLDLAKYLSSIHKVPKAEFYIQETFLQQLKPIGLILATAIPIIISVVTLLMEVK